MPLAQRKGEAAVWAGQAMRDALHRLVRDFDNIALPQHLR